jgi:hypothetical protein
MRTNLTTGSRIALRAADRPDVSRLTVPLALSLTIAAFATIAMSDRALAGDSSRSLFAATFDSSAPAVCHKVDAVKGDLFPRTQIAAYDFTGADAGKLKIALDDISEQVAPSAALVRLVLLPLTDEALAFQFGPDGCHTVTFGATFSEMATVFEAAGVSAPFGRTYYQLPSLSL